MSKLTDEQVEDEIQRLKDSDAVKLVWKYNAVRYRRRQYLYSLRQQEKQGLKLMERGVTMENMEEMCFGEEVPE